MSVPDFSKHGDSKLRLEGTKDYFDTLMKAATLLLVGHGAAILACVTYIQRPGTPPLYGGIGLFAFLVGTGFVFAISGYGLAALGRMNAVSKLFGDPMFRPRLEKFGHRGCVTFLLISAMQLAAAAWGVVFSSF